MAPLPPLPGQLGLSDDGLVGFNAAPSARVHPAPEIEIKHAPHL